jgi:NAD(P)H-dependent FMN reductase
MATHKNILAISGSTRAQSSNLNYIKAIAELTKADFTITIFNQLAEIPHFNPDLDTDNPPQTVAHFRNLLRQADGVLICTPEYAMGVPGTLKNAIDWTVSSCEFSHKPVALITASSLGEKGHASLLETLHVIEAAVTDETQLVISFAKTKISNDAVITDEETLHKVQHLLTAFAALLNDKAA